MKFNTTQSLTAVVSAAGGAALVFFLLRDGKALIHNEPTSNTQNSEQNKVIKVMFHCPMHPQVIRDHAGTCPICGMTLVPMQDHSHVNDQPSDAIHIEANIIQSIGVKTAVVQESELRKSLRITGSIAIDPQRTAVVNSRTMGWIESIAVGSEGLSVNYGQTLATFYSPDLVAAEEDYLQAMRSHDSTLVTSARKRLEVLGVSQSLIDSVHKMGVAIRSIPIQAPIAGVVLAKSVVQGQNVMPGTDLYRIADLSHVWAVGKTYPEDLSQLQSGMAAQVVIQGHENSPRAGHIIFIAPTVDPETKTTEIRVGIQNSRELMFKPGMNADLHIEAKIGKGLAIPAQAVIRTGERSVVILALGKGNFAPRNLTLGTRLGDSVQVLQGLTAGDTIVTSAQFLIDGESNLKKAVEGFGK